MKKTILFLYLAAFTLSSCGDDDADKDMSMPTISGEGIVANPIDCQVYKRGDVISFKYVFSDDRELGNFNIEIHNNFDHHTHGTSSIDCDDTERKSPVNAWVYNQTYSIPSGTVRYTPEFDIEIPDDIDAGLYHFMIRLTDKAGWQQLKSVAIFIEE